MYINKHQEQLIYFDTDEPSIKIKGILNGSLVDKPVVIMMHGLGADPYSANLVRTVADLQLQGITALRLFMYGQEKVQRDLYDCTVQTHVKDFDTVVKQLRPQVKRLFGLGHSYGGLTILMSGSWLDGALLWEPSHGDLWQSIPLVADTASIATDDQGRRFIINQTGTMRVHPYATIEYNRSIGDTSALARKSYPIKIIGGSKSELAPYNQRYFEQAANPKELHVIQGASHRLNDSLAILDELSSQTCNWFTGRINETD